MKKSSKIILTTVLSLAVAGGAFAFGSHHYFSNMSAQEKSEMINYRISRKLDLNSEQEVNLELLTGRLAEIMQEVKDNRQDHDKLMQDLISSQTLDQALLLNKIQQKTAAVNEHAPEVVALLAGFVDSLNAEQKAEIKSMIEKRRGHRFGHGDGHRGGWRE